MKNEIANILVKIIKEKKLIQIQVAEILDLNQSKVSKLLNSKFIFSTERIFKLINLLGYDVFITIKKSKEKIGSIKIIDNHQIKEDLQNES